MFGKKKTNPANKCAAGMMISERASVLTKTPQASKKLQQPHMIKPEKAASNVHVEDDADKITDTSVALERTDLQSKDKVETGNSVSNYTVWIEPVNKAITPQDGAIKRELIRKRTTIGRWSNQAATIADLTIDENPPYTISRQHCEITNTGGQIVITDLNSHYGTQVNQVQIGSAFGEKESIQLSQGSHLLVLGPPECHNHFQITIKECTK